MNSKRLSLSCGKTIIEYRIERRPNRKKTIGIAIDRRNGVVVKVPKLTSSKFIENVIKEKSLWIMNKLQEVESLGRIEPKQFIDGEVFHYLGQDHRLLVDQSTNGISINFSDRRIAAGISEKKLKDADFIEKALRRWYKKQAEIEINKIVNIWSSQTGLVPAEIKIKNLKSSWGNCRRENLSFNWRLIMAPVSLIEYVAVHELCHLKHKNHSKDFWQNVGSFLPDYKQRQMTLKQIGPTFDL